MLVLGVAAFAAVVAACVGPVSTGGSGSGGPVGGDVGYGSDPTASLDEVPDTTGSRSSAPPSNMSPPSGSETARVVAVVDGDTIRVTLDGRVERLRLIGINAPEEGECYAEEAKGRLAELVGDRTVQLTSDVSDRDRYGRLLRYVWVDGVLVNEVLVREGFAIARRYEPDTALQDRLEAAEAAAVADGAGLWAANACGAPSSAALRIREVVYDAPGDDTQNLNGEWVVIVNDGSAPVDMTGWVIKDESAGHRFEFPTGFALAPGATVTVYSGCGTDTPTRLYWCVSGSAIWNNDGDTAFLVDPSGTIVDLWRYGDSGDAASSDTVSVGLIPKAG